MQGFAASSRSANAMTASPPTVIAKDVAAMIRLDVWPPSQDLPCRTKVRRATIGVAALRVVQLRTRRTRPAMCPTKFAILILFCHRLIRRSSGAEGIAKRERVEERTNKTLGQAGFLHRHRCRRPAQKQTVSAADRTLDMRRDAESPSIDEQSPQRKRDRSQRTNRSAEDPGTPRLLPLSISRRKSVASRRVLGKNSGRKNLNLLIVKAHCLPLLIKISVPRVLRNPSEILTSLTRRLHSQIGRSATTVRATGKAPKHSRVVAVTSAAKAKKHSRVVAVASAAEAKKRSRWGGGHKRSGGQEAQQGGGGGHKAKADRGGQQAAGGQKSGGDSGGGQKGGGDGGGKQKGGKKGEDKGKKSDEQG